MIKFPVQFMPGMMIDWTNPQTDETFQLFLIEENPQNPNYWSVSETPGGPPVGYVHVNDCNVRGE